VHYKLLALSRHATILNVPGDSKFMIVTEGDRVDIGKRFSGRLFCRIIGCVEILTHLMSQSFL